MSSSLVSSSARLGAAVTVAREQTRAARQASPDAVNHATKTAPPGALVRDPVTGQLAKVLHGITSHVHAHAAEK